MATLAIGILLGLGVLLAWLRTRPEAGTAGPKRLAVLPFENLGRPEDEYFADGVTDEVRGKLAALPGLEVIARTSSVQYKETTKSPQQIGRELGVDYLLTGTVRWEKDAGGPSRVRVSPELVQVSTASTKWQAPFEAPLTDVFQVQADVAARVAEALGLALGAGERERLAERPTQNLAAYDAFLRARRRPRRRYGRTAACRRAATTTSARWPWTPPSPSPGLSSRGSLVSTSTPSGSPRRAGRALAGASRARAWRSRRSSRWATTPWGTTTQRRQDMIGRSSGVRPRARSSPPRTPASWRGWCEMDLRRGQWERALEAARRRRALDPRSTEPLLDAAMALHTCAASPRRSPPWTRALVLDSLSPGWYPARLDIQRGRRVTCRRAPDGDLAERRLGYSRRSRTWE